MLQTTRATVSQAEALTGQVHIGVVLGPGGIAFLRHLMQDGGRRAGDL